LPHEKVIRRCERAKASWAPVGQPADLFTDPHLLATGGLLGVFVSRMGGGWSACRPSPPSKQRMAGSPPIRPAYSNKYFRLCEKIHIGLDRSILGCGSNLDCHMHSHRGSPRTTN
jgi:hypothetical protein